MSTRQIGKRLGKIEKRVSPENDGKYLWPEFKRLYLMWKNDRERFLELANRDEGYVYRSFMARCKLREPCDTDATRTYPIRIVPRDKMGVCLTKIVLKGQISCGYRLSLRSLARRRGSIGIAVRWGWCGSVWQKHA